MRTSTLIFVLFIVTGCDLPQPSGTHQSSPSSAPKRTTTSSGKASVLQIGDKGNQAPVPVPIPKQKWNLDYAEKAWGLKLKDFKSEVILPQTGESFPASPMVTYKLLLEFTKDLNEADLRAVTGAFGTHIPPQPYDAEFVVIDEDSVVTGSLGGQFSYQGQVTGVKGDAVWLVIRHAGFDVPRDGKSIQRIELRPKKK
jgi:hypothetical protein